MTDRNVRNLSWLEAKGSSSRLLNLHRRVKAGEDFEEPTSEQEALERIATLEDAVENRA